MSSNPFEIGSTIIVRVSDLLTAEVDGELVAMSVEQGKCYGLNAVGTRVWNLIEQPRSVDSVCEQLMIEYAIEEAQCRREVAELLQSMHTQKMLTFSAS